MTSLVGAGHVEEFLLVLGLVSVQVVYGFYGVFIARLLAIGLSPLFVIMFGSLATSIILSPFAVIFEKSKWPRELSLSLMVQLVVIAAGGVSMFQVFMLLGIRDTSPAIASAMPNLAPGIIFLIAWCLRLEKVDLKCKYTGVKILGTLICLGGAFAISFSRGGDPTSQVLTSNPAEDITGKNGLMGDMYLLIAVLMLSFTLVLQAHAMRELPAPMTVCAITSLIGSILTGLMLFIVEGKMECPQVLTVAALVLYVLVGGVINGVCIAFQAWAMKQRGPLLVSLFSPISTICTAVLSVVTLGESLTLLSIGGMVLMFTGLYFVLWAKKKEGYSAHDDKKHAIDDPEKPLLS